MRMASHGCTPGQPVTVLPQLRENRQAEGADRAPPKVEQATRS